MVEGCLHRSSRLDVLYSSPLEESGTFNLDPAGGRATEYDVGMLASDPRRNGSAIPACRKELALARSFAGPMVGIRILNQ
jgi:hypothetical protein